jgi:hypothetical protein
MKRFRFTADFTVDADSVETLLNRISSHLGDAARHVGNERPVSDACKHFGVEEVSVDWKAEAAARAAAAEKGLAFDDGTTDLHDHALDEHGTIALNLDPKSPAGMALVEQETARKAEREAAERARANASKSDAEIMADLRAREEAADPANR